MMYARRKAAMLAMAASTALTAIAMGVSPANAVTAIPQDGTGSSSWVTMNLFDRSSTQVEIKAWVNFPGNIRYNYGHWQILTPTEHRNTPDGIYQDYDGYFANNRGNYCAIWWYWTGSGYENEGEPCVGN
jgi:hypothetical protein